MYVQRTTVALHECTTYYVPVLRVLHVGLHPTCSIRIVHTDLPVKYKFLSLHWHRSMTCKAHSINRQQCTCTILILHRSLHVHPQSNPNFYRCIVPGLARPIQSIAHH